MREIVADVLIFQRLENWLFGTFAFLAVLLAIVGLYGLISHEVELSTHDMGIRLALGATRVRVLAGVYRRVGVMLVAGVAIGSTGNDGSTEVACSRADHPRESRRGSNRSFGCGVDLRRAARCAPSPPAGLPGSIPWWR